MKFILGTKQNMSQVFDQSGEVHPVTVLNAGPVVVTRIINKDKDGYNAIKVGFGSRKAKNINKAQKGEIGDLGSFRYLREFRVSDGSAAFTVGDKLDAGVFSEGDTVEVSAISKGKGFQGVVKRHGFKGGPRTHGQKHSEREPGSIGGGLRNRVPKNMRMAGRMGGDRVTVKNLKIVKIDAENNQIMIEGAVPGRRGTLVEVRG